MQSLILILHVLVAITIIALVLLQHGRGADVGAAFGSGASNTMFGSASALPFMVKLTAVFAAIFFGTSIALSNMAARQAHQQAAALQMPAQPADVSIPVEPVKKDTNAEDDGISFVPSTKKKG